MKALALSRYGRLGASSRLRTLQFVPCLQEAGIQLDVAPFFENQYLEDLYARLPTRSHVFRAFARRLQRLLASRAYDLILIEKEVLPWVPWIIERVLLPKGVPIVVDYDDAVFHRYDQHRSSIVRGLLGHKLDRLMAHSSLVMAGNEYLASRAREAGAARIAFVPTVVDLAAYGVRATSPEDNGLNVGWIGTPSTWTSYMKPMVPVLQESIAPKGARLRVVGAGKAASELPFLDEVAWSEEDEVTEIQKMDIGLMPLTDTPWARGKCGYKLIQYMACGLPVVASPVGVNSSIVEHGVNGFLASTEREWRTAISTLLANKELRERMGAAGREKIEKNYSLQIWAPKVAALLRDVVENRRLQRNLSI
ncbi:MAG: glycosyltransferase family 1 protein [Rhodobacteraceae bacterium]|nr:MAG: glycosyltransferase family 1 protein [Paracoccaceae bacterium]